MVNLRKLREERGLTLSSVANDCGISISGLSKIERGKLTLNDYYAKKLSDFYGIKIESFVVVEVAKDERYESIYERRTLYMEDNDRLKAENKKYKHIIVRLENCLQKANKEIDACLKVIEEMKK